MSKTVRLILMLVAMITLLGVIVAAVGLEPTLQAVIEAGWPAFLLLGVLMGLLVVLQALAWQALNCAIGHKIPFLTVLRAATVGLAVNILAPSGSVGGEPVKVLYVGRKTGLPFLEIAGTIVLSKYLEALSFIFLAGPCVIIALLKFREHLLAPQNHVVGVTLLAVALALPILCAALLFAPLRQRTPLTAVVGFLVRMRIFPSFFRNVKEHCRTMEHQVSRVFRREQRAVLKALFYFVIAHASFLVKPAIFFYMGWRTELSAADLTLLFLVFQGLQAVQLTPSGAGVIDTGMLGIIALGGMDITNPQCVAFMLCIRFWEFVVVAFGAALAAHEGMGFFVRKPAPGRVSMWQRIVLLWGRPRRLFLNVLRKGYVRHSLARRRGECLRCGACCKMGTRCAHLTYEEGGLSGCAVYANRWSPNCRTFPIDERDLADRDMVMPDKPCGYTFIKTSEGRS